jgi:hypothetical protein
MGSIRAARRAGQKLAISPAANKIKTTAMKE